MARTYPTIGSWWPSLCKDRADQTIHGGCRETWDPADRQFQDNRTGVKPFESQAGTQDSRPYDTTPQTPGMSTEKATPTSSLGFTVAMRPPGPQVS